MLNAGLRVNQQLGHAVEPLLVLFTLARGLGELSVVLVNEATAAHRPWAGEAQLLDFGLGLGLLLIESFNARLGLFSHLSQVCSRLVLGQELGDDLVHVFNASCLLDTSERFLVRGNLLLLQLQLVLCAGAVEALRNIVFDQILLPVQIQLPSCLQLELSSFAFPLLHSLVQFDLGLDHFSSFCKLLLANLALLLNRCLELLQLELRSFLGALSITTHLNELVQVGLLGFESLHHCCKLHIEGSALVGQPLLDMQIGLLKRLGFVDFHQRFLQLVFKHPNIPYHWMVGALDGSRGVLLQILELVLARFKVQLLSSDNVANFVVLLLQFVHFLIQLLNDAGTASLIIRATTLFLEK
mmetsp:Transcript_24301/g.56328  ORF Transcript_24301/g.56328 Transcript_24301/m.56328 type:complete len:355 (+) Transcript_24301:666-1730(+)